MCECGRRIHRWPWSRAPRGIGAGIADRLAGDGWALALLDVDADGVTAQAERLATRFGTEILALPADTSDELQVASALATTQGRFGRLDALVNNAGIADPETARVEALDRATWDRYLAVNLTGYFLLAKHAMKLLRTHRGAIVNIASIHAWQSDAGNNLAYAASKGGVVAFTHALAIAEGPEVRVNSISPGWIDVRDPERKQREPLREIDHAQHPAGRVGEPRDIAAAVAFLISDDAGFITAQDIIVDGGMMKRMNYAE